MKAPLINTHYMLRLFNKETSDNKMLGKEELLAIYLLYMKQ